ncbi:unnamed protein product [Caenorhabditis brenneri]
MSSSDVRAANRELMKEKNALKLKKEKIAELKRVVEDREKVLERTLNKVNSETEKVEELSECKICTYQYDHHHGSNFVPYQLDCGHTVCKTCVQTMFQEKFEKIKPQPARDTPMIIKCPFCKTVLRITNPEATLPEDQIMNNTLRAFLRL